MNADDVKALADAVTPVLKRYIDTRLAEVQSQKGDMGPQGEKGEKGDPGESVDMAAVKEWIAQKIESDVAWAVAKIEVPKGEKGDPGEKGDVGPQGEKGDPGQSVPMEDVERLVEKAVAAIEVVVPEPRDGRDALDIEILPTIDPEKSYPRGTFATFKGGLWRAFQQTHEMKGWECIVKGVMETELTRLDDRTFVIKCVDSTGVVTHRQFDVPAMIYRGVFKAGEKYKAGDVVTSGGSMWHCEKDDPQGTPGNSDDWKLCVKKGRDAR